MEHPYIVFFSYIIQQNLLLIIVISGLNVCDLYSNVISLEDEVMAYRLKYDI